MLVNPFVGVGNNRLRIMVKLPALGWGARGRRPECTCQVSAVLPYGMTLNVIKYLITLITTLEPRFAWAGAL